MPSQILTDRQQAELNKAVLQYLQPICSTSETNENLFHQLEKLLLPSKSNAQNSNSDDGLVEQYLEKKWSTVLRLQKRIIDLENEITNLRSVVDVAPVVNLSKDRVNWIPTSAIQTFETPNVVNSVRLHPVLPLVYAGCNDGSINIWNFASDDNALPEKIMKAHTRGVNKLAFSQDKIELNKGDEPQYILASCSSDLTIKLYNATTHQHLKTLRGHDHTVSSIQFSKSNLLYSVSRDKTIKAWNVVDGTCIKSFVGHSEWVRDLDVCSSKLGDFVLTCSNDQSARLSHGQSGTGVALLIGHSHVIEAVRFLPKLSNSVIDTFIMNNSDLFPSLPIELLKNDVYGQFGFKYCLTASRDNTIKLWLLPPPTQIPGRPPMPSKYNQAQAWLIANLTGHTSWVKSVQVHPNGKYVLSASDDKTIKVWDLNGLNIDGSVGVIRSLSSHQGFVSDIDFARLAKRSEDFNGNSEEVLKDVEARMRCVLVSGGTDNTVKVWK
ncbi:LIS1 [Candida theae]|uniref:Nuclear distribution protein PAC1 n=1 Tax=Candida theae TaxID=1198502 RepID=A0AAD5BKC3_9ASCO|nr:LIS1 [Candida theae]KAI5968486.1 LIS1 [Candida theae]